MKKQKALIIGKFLPLHDGHVAMINHARTIADEVIVMICAEDKEPIRGSVRMKWIEDEFRDCDNVLTDLFQYDEDEGFPATSESSRDVSKVWAKMVNDKRKIDPYYYNIDVIVSSEKYGDYMAEYLEIEHEMFDEEREQYPVSGTMIRDNYFNYWNYLPDTVKETLQTTIVLLGTESTGKTTLAETIETLYGRGVVGVVEEVGRDMVDDSTDFDYEILPKIIEKHRENYDKVKERLTPIILMDTDLHTTMSYGIHCFSKSPVDYTDYLYYDVGDVYIHCSIDEIEWVQDGTRMPKDERDKLDTVLQTILRLKGVEYITLTGTHTDRLPKVMEIIDDQLNKLTFN